MKTTALLALGLALACATHGDEEVRYKRTFFKDVPRPAVSSEHGPRIYHGEVASRKQFPFQAGVYINFSGFCGGSLIHKNWVLTAAHCVDGYAKWAVFLGVSDVLRPKQEGRVVHVSVTATRHDAYDSQRIVNDIGLIRLRRDVELNEYIGLSKLAPAGVNYAGKLATVSGFGLIEDQGVRAVSPVLMYTSLRVVSSAVCYHYYYSSFDSPLPVDVSQICAEAKASSSCSGDSGGPLTVLQDDGKRVQIGLTSFGSSDGCSHGAPVGFTRVNLFYEWLSQATGVNFP